VDWRALILGREPIPELAHDSVHVWRVSTAAGHQDMEHLSEILSPEETERSARFHFDKDRRSYVVCRGTLRLLLGEYLRCDPRAIRFSYGAHGKPAWEQAEMPELPVSLRLNLQLNLRFNVSHSGELALLAFGLGREVGVDVEKMRENLDFDGLAKLSFSSAEYAAFLECPSTRRANLFYEYWSCKEACIKADGRGLSAGLRQFSVVAQGDGPEWRQVESISATSLSPEMRVRILTTGDGYAAAVAADGKDWDVRQFLIPDEKHSE